MLKSSSTLQFPPNFQSPPQKIIRGFSLLLEAFQYADDVDCDCWEFAVEIRRLRAVGMNESDLRWITIKGLAQHARELTTGQNDGRSFEESSSVLLGDNSCFVLTEEGSQVALQLDVGSVVHNADPESVPACTLPHWDSDIRELHMYGRIVKRFKWQAINQETVLSAFQEDGWPTVIDDPLPPKPEQDPRRRLHDTIKALNRNQVKPTIRFRGNGTGEGIRWEPLGTDAVAPRLT